MKTKKRCGGKNVLRSLINLYRFDDDMISTLHVLYIVVHHAEFCSYQERLDRGSQRSKETLPYSLGLKEMIPKVRFFHLKEAQHSFGSLPSFSLKMWLNWAFQSSNNWLGDAGDAGSSTQHEPYWRRQHVEPTASEGIGAAECFCDNYYIYSLIFPLDCIRTKDHRTVHSGAWWLVSVAALHKC